MEKKFCNVCKKRFTRQWNLERHLKDIHNISGYHKNDINKQKNVQSTYSSIYSIKNQPFRNSDNHMISINHYSNTPGYHILQRYDNETNYNNWFYPNDELVTIDKKEPMLTIEDGIRIRTALQILQNVLSRFYPPNLVIRIICLLQFQCFTKHSDEPLIEFYKKYNIWVYL
ncbi:MAG: C2H2-type zinc finger protein [Nitrososphaeraceae archaeon]